MTKEDFLNAVQSLFDACANYNPVTGGLRTFTDSERHAFLEKLSALMSECQTTISETKLTMALIQTSGRHQSLQDQAAAILSRL